MKNLFFAVFVILAFCSSLFAQHFDVPLDQLVKESDLIIDGHLLKVSRYTKNNITYSEGKLIIEKVISGNVKTSENFALKPGDSIKLTWQNPSDKVNPYVELGGRAEFGEVNESIWILKVKSGGTVTADSIFCIRAAIKSNEREIRKILRQEKTQKDLLKVKLYNENFLNNQSQQTHIANAIQETNNQLPERSLLGALIIVLFSLSLHWILYRSKHKIR